MQKPKPLVPRYLRLPVKERINAVGEVLIPLDLASVDAMIEKGIRDDYIVLVGGAPLNEAFGESVGADAYCRDAAVAVETAKALIAKRREAGAA